MKLTCWLLTGILGLTVLSNETNAATIVQGHPLINLGIASSMNPGTHFDGNIIQTPFYDLFDPSLGTLTGAKWILESTFVTSGGGSAGGTTSNDPLSATFTVVAGVGNLGAAVEGLGVVSGSLLGAGNQFFGMNKTLTGSCSTDGSGSCSVDLGIHEEAFDGTIVATNLTQLTGPGRFIQYWDGAVSVTIAVSDPLSGRIQGDGSFRWDAQLSLVYDYEPVPEPSTFALAALAAGALAVRFRR